MKYFILKIKSKIRTIPILFIILLIFMGSFYIILDNFKNHKINLEIHFEEESLQNNIIISMIRGTQSTKNNIILNISNDFYDSTENLKKGKIDVFINVPSGFYESILNGENKKATIYFSNSSTNLAKGIFKSLSESSVELLSSAQSNIYISDSIIDGYEKDRNIEMNRVFMNNALNREDNFKFEPIQSDIDFAYLYIIILISSIVFLSLKNKYHLQIYSHFKVKNKKIWFINLMEILSNTLILFIFSIIIALVLKTDFSKSLIINTMKIFLICFFISALSEFLFIVFEEASIFLILVICILSILNLGIILPRNSIYIVYLFPINLIISNNIISYTIFISYSLSLFLFGNIMIERRMK